MLYITLLQGCLGKIRTREALYNAKKSIIPYPIFLNFLSHAPFGATVVIFPHAQHQCAVKTVVLSLPVWYLQAFWQFRAFSTH